MIIGEDEIRKAISAQLREWTFAARNAKFSRFQGVNTSDMECDLSKIPDDLFVMILTAFPGIFYSASKFDQEGIEEVMGLFSSMTPAEKNKFRERVKTKYAKQDVGRIKVALSTSLDLAFPGTSYIVCSQITSLAKLFGGVFGISFALGKDVTPHSNESSLDSAQIFSDIMDELAQVIKNHVMDASGHSRRSTLLKFNFEAFAIFPSVVSDFASDNYTDTLAQRKQDFENNVLNTRSSSAEDLYLSLTNYYSSVKDSELNDKINNVCKKIDLLSLSDTELRAVIGDLEFRCDFGHNNLKMFL